MKTKDSACHGIKYLKFYYQAMLFHIQGLINDTEKRRKGEKIPKIAETDEDKKSMMRFESAASKSKNILGYRMVLV